MKKLLKIRIRPLHVALIYGAISLFFIFEALTAEHLQYSFGFVGWGGTFRYHNAKLFGLSLYQLLIVVSVFVSIAFSLIRRKYTKRSVVAAVAFPILIFLVCFVGAKLLFVIECFDTVKQNGLGFDGFSLFGAIFLTPPVAFLVSRFQKEKTAKLLDEVIYYELIMLVAIRTGCFLQGCCHGVTYWQGDLPIVLPVQLFEVICDLLILDFCIRLRDSKGKIGHMYPWFMMLYSACRFLLEFLRNNPKTVWWLTNAQLFSIFGFVAGLLLLKYFAKKQQRG